MEIADAALKERIAREEDILGAQIKTNAARRVARRVDHFDLQIAYGQYLSFLEKVVGSHGGNVEKEGKAIGAGLLEIFRVEGMDRKRGFRLLLELICVGEMIPMGMGEKNLLDGEAKLFGFLEQCSRRTRRSIDNRPFAGARTAEQKGVGF